MFPPLRSRVINACVLSSVAAFAVAQVRASADRSRLSGLEALDASNNACHGLASDLGVVVRLKIEPALRVSAGEGTQAQCRVRRDPP
jgi:hypothetical protein